MNPEFGVGYKINLMSRSSIIKAAFSGCPLVIYIERGLETSFQCSTPPVPLPRAQQNIPPEDLNKDEGIMPY